MRPHWVGGRGQVVKVKSGLETYRNGKNGVCFGAQTGRKCGLWCVFVENNDPFVRPRNWDSDVCGRLAGGR